MHKILPKLILATVSVLAVLMGWLSRNTLAETELFQDSRIIIATKIKDVSGSDIARVRKEAEKALTVIPLTLGFEYNNQVKIEIVDEGICRTGSDDHIVFLPIWHITNKRAAIIHEVSHAIVRRHENNSFFSEGLAEFFQGKFGEDIAGAAYYEEPLSLSLDDLVRKHRDNLLSLSYLGDNNDIYMQMNTEKRKLAYIEAGSFMKFLYEIHGGQKLQDLYDSRTLNYKKIYGKNLKELEADWLTYVLRSNL